MSSSARLVANGSAARDAAHGASGPSTSVVRRRTRSAIRSAGPAACRRAHPVRTASMSTKAPGPTQTSSSTAGRRWPLASRDHSGPGHEPLSRPTPSTTRTRHSVAKVLRRRRASPASEDQGVVGACWAGTTAAGAPGRDAAAPPRRTNSAAATTMTTHALHRKDGRSSMEHGTARSGPGPFPTTRESKWPVLRSTSRWWRRRCCRPVPRRGVRTGTPAGWLR